VTREKEKPRGKIGSKKGKGNPEYEKKTGVETRTLTKGAGGKKELCEFRNMTKKEAREKGGTIFDIQRKKVSKKGNQLCEKAGAEGANKTNK